MAADEPVIEIHIPLVPGVGVPVDEYQFPWIFEVEGYLTDLEEEGDLEVVGDGDELDDEYVFYIGGATEAHLVAVAARVAALPSVPAGAYGILTTEDAPAGTGTRVDLDG
ncbi:hypothetical protein [Galbitalea soli]|uniref:DUF695 domain-containing protein n=1 Tax=Galbitalea soli TaxID=1268042 RepID=A0A7C9TN54_9MICO|nr:hypothetical protein [Galbitalea soli]NEM90137.1 hypothetical protein [Galbitalea soli]NYJ30845.1 hypothetical protein [Galbitalea soli]